MIRVEIPYHLQTLAKAGPELALEVDAPVTPRAILDALETRYPVLRGMVRDTVTGERRPLVRFFACAEDLSHAPTDTLLPDAVAKGKEPFLIIGAIAGG
jgi:hypothetical protein